MNNLKARHFLLKAILIILLILFFGFHLLTAIGVISYETLWGTALAGSSALNIAEAFASALIFLFLLSAIGENSRIPMVGTLSKYGLMICAVYMLLNFFAYLKCDSIGLKILMGLFTLVVTINIILLLITQKQLKNQKKKRKEARKQ